MMKDVHQIIEQLLSQGYERRDARGEVEGQVARALARWAGAL